MSKLIRANYESSAAYDAACEADEAVSRIDVVAEIRLYTTGNRQSAIDYSHTIVPHASLDGWADHMERLEAREAAILALAKRWEAGIYHHAAKIAGEDDLIMSLALHEMNHMRRELRALLNPQGDTL